MIEFGAEYEDGATGFKGTATARTETMTGNVSVCLEFIGNDGKPDEVWLPEARLRPVEQKKVGP